MYRYNIIYIVLIVCLASNVVFSQQTCRAIAFSGAADRGAYEAGVVMGLVENADPQDVQWQVVTGVSAGSINAAAVTMFNVGNEVGAKDFIVNQWLNITKEKIYKNWDGGIVEILQKSVFDTSPLHQYLDSCVNQTLVANSDRTMLIGATNIDTGLFQAFDQKDPEIVLAIMASSAMPGLFPKIQKDGYSYCDGGIVFMTPVSSAIELCMAKGATDVIVDVMIINDPNTFINETNQHTLALLAREGQIIVKNIFMKDIMSARAAYPNAQINIHSPSEQLPGDFIGFQYSKVMIEMGYKDAVAGLNSRKKVSNKL
ncbi:hypothetical protein CYY_005508 [Polysphondylium violaceum]|uniref:PNPLA domain-containing protein n=1 Tax=Polysphondylium violaceum TaxID=133409 RepID=A0A8J4PU52_9MYCE|nr:hypothetical protein CYY_005508 [Polysphondylium violaceum]